MWGRRARPPNWVRFVAGAVAWIDLSRNEKRSGCPAQFNIEARPSPLIRRDDRVGFSDGRAWPGRWVRFSTAGSGPNWVCFAPGAWVSLASIESAQLAQSQGELALFRARAS